MNKMIAITIRPGATTAAARLICPFACKSPPPEAVRTSAKVPSNSENSRRRSLRGSSKSLRSPNSSRSMWCVRGKAAPSVARSICWAVAPLTASVPCAVPRVPGPSSRLTGTSSAMFQSLHQQHRRSFTMRIASACKSFADGSHVGCRGPSGPNRASISGSAPRPRRPAPGSPGRIRRAGVEPPPAPDHKHRDRHPPTMPAIRSTGLNNNLIIVFSHPPDNQPARHQPDGSAAPRRLLSRSQAHDRQFRGPAPARPPGTLP